MIQPADAPLSAVVVNYNGGARLIACLESLYAHAGPLAEVIVVDNGSDDGSAEQARAAHPEIRLLRLTDNPGPSVARNRGLAAARASRVLLLDSDTRLTPGAVAEMQAAQSQTGAAVIVPRLVFAPGETQIQCDGAAPHFVGTLILRNANAPRDAGGPAQEVDGLISTCLLVDRDAALRAGGFNETFFFYFEDLEFGLRLRLLGHRIVCVPRAVVVHDRGAGYEGLSFRGAGAYPARRAYLSMRNRLLTIAICYHWRTILVLSPALVVYEAATLTLALMRGWLGHWARGWRWMIAHRREVAQMRRNVQAHRCVPDREVLHGTPLPLADGLFGNRIVTALIAVLSGSLSVFWRIARGAVH